MSIMMRILEKVKIVVGTVGYATEKEEGHEYIGR
jgi:hypothetical protein